MKIGDPSFKDVHPFRFLAVMIFGVLCVSASGQSAPPGCSTNDVRVMLARQFVERNEVTQTVAYFTHFDWAVIPVTSDQLGLPQCKSVSVTDSRVILTYEYKWLRPLEMEFAFDLRGKFIEVLHPPNELIHDVDRYKKMQQLIDYELSDGKQKHSENDPAASIFVTELLKILLDLHDSGDKLSDARFFFDVFLRIRARVLNYGFPPEEAMDRQHVYLSTFGSFFLEVSAPEAAAIMRGVTVDLDPDMVRERETVSNAVNRFSSWKDLIIRADNGKTRFIPVLGENAGKLGAQDRKAHFMEASFPKDYEPGATKGGHGYLMQLSDGRFGLVPIDDFNGKMIPPFNPDAPIPRQSAPEFIQLSEDQFGAALVQSFQEVANEAHLDASQYREDLDYITEVVKTCASLSSSSAYSPSLDPRYAQRASPSLRKCYGIFNSLPVERVKPVSKEKPRRLFYGIQGNRRGFLNSDHFTIAVYLSGLAHDVAPGGEEMLFFNYGILAAEIPRSLAPSPVITEPETGSNEAKEGPKVFSGPTLLGLPSGTQVVVSSIRNDSESPELLSTILAVPVELSALNSTYPAPKGAKLEMGALVYLRCSVSTGSDGLLNFGLSLDHARFDKKDFPLTSATQVIQKRMKATESGTDPVGQNCIGSHSPAFGRFEKVTFTLTSDAQTR